MKLLRLGILSASFLLAGCFGESTPEPGPNTVNDVTRLNPIEVERVVAPTSIEEIAALVASHDGPISIGGGRFSQGGQTACTGCLFIDMRTMNRIQNIDVAQRRITVESGVTWRQIQEAVDPLDLSPKIMQSFSNFTVGGSISVNCHGDYVGLGPLVSSLVSMRLVMADGAIVTASRDENTDLFSAAVGGYGGVGVIVEATLDLAQNTRLERKTQLMNVSSYPQWRADNIAQSDTAILHHAVIYPPDYRRLIANTSSLTDRQVTIPHRLAPLGEPGAFERGMLSFVTDSDFGKAFRENVYDAITVGGTEVVWRNYEAAQDAMSLEPASRAKSTYVLQEYFVPTDRYDAFVTRMSDILRKHKVNVLNVAVRHSTADRETLLSWAPDDVFSFVLYCEQRTDAKAREKVAVWTRELVDAAIAEGGAHYLPYQIHATPEQFLKAYPRAPEFFALKQRVDPTYKFRNRLWETYFPAAP